MQFFFKTMLYALGSNVWLKGFQDPGLRGLTAPPDRGLVKTWGEGHHQEKSGPGRPPDVSSGAGPGRNSEMPGGGALGAVVPSRGHGALLTPAKIGHPPVWSPRLRPPRAPHGRVCPHTPEACIENMTIDIQKRRTGAPDQRLELHG